MLKSDNDNMFTFYESGIKGLVYGIIFSNEIYFSENFYLSLNKTATKLRLVFDWHHGRYLILNKKFNLTKLNLTDLQDWSRVCEDGHMILHTFMEQLHEIEDFEIPYEIKMFIL